jgi:hypothetical protein
VFEAIDPASILAEDEDVYANRDRYIRIIDDVIALLQGRDPALAHRFLRTNYLPEGPRFYREPALAHRFMKTSYLPEGPRFHRAAQLGERHRFFGPLNKVDFARYLATLTVRDLTDLFEHTITPHFGLTAYAQVLTESRATFDEVQAELTRAPNVIETIMLEVAGEHLAGDLDLVCFTCPFPGNLLSSLLLGKWLAAHHPRAQRALGGGFPSTELRSLSDPRVFDYVDYIVMDDGEVPLRQICARVAGDRQAPLQRTFVREDDRVVWRDETSETPRFRELPPPDYRGLAMDRYVHLIFSRNPVSRLLSA